MERDEAVMWFVVVVISIALAVLVLSGCRQQPHRAALGQALSQCYADRDTARNALWACEQRGTGK